jgi:hypothetical protein
MEKFLYINELGIFNKILNMAFIIQSYFSDTFIKHFVTKFT